MMYDDVRCRRPVRWLSVGSVPQYPCYGSHYHQHGSAAQSDWKSPWCRVAGQGSTNDGYRYLSHLWYRSRGQAIEHAIWMMQWVKGIWCFEIQATFFCIKGSSPTKRSCMRRRRSCLHDSLVHMQRTVGQRVLGTSASKNNKDTMFGWFDSRNTFHSTPSQSWCATGVPAMLTIKAFEDLFWRLLQADVALLQGRCGYKASRCIANQVQFATGEAFVVITERFTPVTSAHGLVLERSRRTIGALAGRNGLRSSWSPAALRAGLTLPLIHLVVESVLQTPRAVGSRTKVAWATGTHELRQEALWRNTKVGLYELMAQVSTGLPWGPHLLELQLVGAIRHDFLPVRQFCVHHPEVCPRLSRRFDDVPAHTQRDLIVRDIQPQLRRQGMHRIQAIPREIEELQRAPQRRHEPGGFHLACDSTSPGKNDGEWIRSQRIEQVGEADLQVATTHLAMHEIHSVSDHRDCWKAECEDRSWCKS